jgi:hypothetical protein
MYAIPRSSNDRQNPCQPVNLPSLLIPGVKIHVRLTKAKDSFYLMNTERTSISTFKFLEAELNVRCVWPNPDVLTAHHLDLAKGGMIELDFTRVELRARTFRKGTKSLALGNAILGRTPKRIVFTMIKNSDFIGSKDSNPFNFRHYKLTYFSINVNGRQIPSGWLTLDMTNEKTSVLAYYTLFTACGIHHADTGLQISRTMYLTGFFMYLFDLTPDLAGSGGHTSLLPQGSIQIDLRFAEALPDLVTCLMYLEFDNSVQTNTLKQVFTDF